MPPQVNGRLTRIAAAAGTTGQAVAPVDDWDVDVAPVDRDAGGPLAAGEKWAGELDVYYRENVERVATGDSVTDLTTRTVYIDTADLPDGLDTDDVLRIELDDGRTVQAAVRAIARASHSRAAATSTTRLELERA